MFVFYRNEVKIATIESPLWVRILPNGFFGSTGQEQATGVVLYDTIYKLDSKEADFEADIISYQYIESGEYIRQQNIEIQQEITELELSNIEAQQLITELELQILGG